MMGKYRKKPVVVEAIQFDGDNWGEISHWVHRNLSPENNAIILRGVIGLEVRTLDGTMSAYKGDWIVKGVKGEVYPMKDSIFKETHEEVI